MTDNEKERIYRAAVELWVGDIHLCRAMEREELAGLEGMQRHIALSKGLLPNMVRVLRRHSRADSRCAVLTLIHLLSDNNDGLCRLSIARFAQILNRKEDNIRLAILDLEQGGEIGVEHSPFGNSYWPKIDVALANMSPSMGWFVDALSDKPRPRNRPAGSRNNIPPQTGGSSEGETLSQKNIPLIRPETPPRRRGTYISKLNHSKIDNHEGASSKSSTRGRCSKKMNDGGLS